MFPYFGASWKSQLNGAYQSLDSIQILYFTLGPFLKATVGASTSPCICCNFVDSAVHRSLVYQQSPNKLSSGFFCFVKMCFSTGRCPCWSWCSSRLLIRFLCQQIYFSLTFTAENLWLPSLWARLISMPGCARLSFIKTMLLFFLFHWLKNSRNILAALAVILKGTELK